MIPIPYDLWFLQNEKMLRRDFIDKKIDEYEQFVNEYYCSYLDSLHEKDETNDKEN